MIEIFISYSHKDESLRKELDIHLAGLKRLGFVSVWHDRRIIAGEEFEKKISDNLSTAGLILLLISPDFIASDYCYDVELSTALERHKTGSATVLPVILRPCDWHDLPFGGLLATPPDGKPISKYASLDDGFLEVVKAIKSIIKSKTEKLFVPAAGRTTRIISIDDSETRSSNLRIKREFSDEERDNFESESFEYIARFFENSIDELSKRNLNITGKFSRINAYVFEAIVYSSGKEKAACTITLKRDAIYSSGISFSYGRNRNGYNESFSIENDGYIQYLRPTMKAASYGSDNKERLTMEGAAELYWELFIRELQ